MARIVPVGVLVLAAVVTGLFLLRQPEVPPTGPPAQADPAALAAVSSAAGLRERAYWVRDHRHRATARGHGLRSSYDSGGATFRAGTAQLGMELERLTRGTAARAVAAAEPATRRNRVEYARPGLKEWYANGPLGVEQGFDLARRPLRGGDGWMALGLRLSGGLKARLEDGGDGALFTSPDGQAVLSYGGLKVWDARHEPLPAHLRLDGSRLEIAFDDSRARYPLHVDPLVQVAKLPAGDNFQGAPVEVSDDGSTIVLGVNTATTNTFANAGAVHVYTKPPGAWATPTLAATLTASDAEADDGLGDSVAMAPDGSSIVAGAARRDLNGANNVGGVYVFDRPAGGWATATQTAILRSGDNSTIQDEFLGTAVEISGDGQTIAGQSNTFTQIFTRPAGGWVDTSFPTATVRPSGAFGSPGGTDQIALTADGSLLFLGDPRHDANGHDNQGQVSLFQRPGGGWVDDSTEDARIGYTCTTCTNTRFGSAVSITPDGGTVAVGATNFAFNGDIHVYERPAGGWTGTDTTPEASLEVSDQALGDEIGAGVAITPDGSTVIGGAPSRNVAPNNNAGEVYRWNRPAGGWTGDITQSDRAVAADGVPNDQLGLRVAVPADAGFILAGTQTSDVYAFAQNAGVHDTDTEVSCTPYVVVQNAQTTECTVVVSDIAPAGATAPTGSVAFTRTGSGGGTFSAGSCTLAALGAAGATCQVTYAPTGGDNDVPRLDEVTAEYLPDATHLGTSDVALVDVSPTKRVTSVSVNCLPSAVPLGEYSLCTFTVQDVAGAIAPSAPTGNVTVFALTIEDAEPDTCKLVPTGDGKARCTSLVSPGGPAGTDDFVRGNYQGDTDHLPGSTGTAAVGGVTALAAGTGHVTSTTLACPDGTIALGTTITCTATVTDTDAAPSAPSGTVYFTSDEPYAMDPASKSCTLGSPTASSASCSVQYTPQVGRVLSARTDDVGASFVGNASHKGSSTDPFEQIGVSAAPNRPTRTTVGCSAASTAVGTPVTCTVTVTDTGSDTKSAPSGFVSLWSASLSDIPFPDGCTLGAPTADSASCSLTYTPTGIGYSDRFDTVLGAFPGDNLHQGSRSEAAGNSVIGAHAPGETSIAATRTTVECAPDAVAVGAASTCTARVEDLSSSGASAPAGTVTLSSSGAAGTFSAATCTLAADGASAATCASTFTPTEAGTATVLAAYGGNATHGPSSVPVAEGAAITATGAAVTPTATATTTPTETPTETTTTAPSVTPTAQPPSATPVRDVIPPALSALAISPKRFRVASGATAITAAKAKQGAKLSFTLSERASVAFAIQSRRKGRRAGGKCKPKAKQGKRCTLTKVAGTLTRANLAAGAGTVAFSGRIGTRKLKPGSYAVVATPVDAAGNAGTPATVSFKIVRR